MVPTTQHTCKSSSPTPRNVLPCLICLKTIHCNNTKYVPKVSEILSDLFEVLCKYMDWSPPLRYQFNFTSDVFPFCKECKLTLVTLYKSHQLLADVQKQINSVISKLCAKILLSQKDKVTFNMGDKFIDSSQRDSPCKEIERERDEKAIYFRNLVEKRYSASVRITAYTQPMLEPSLTEAIDDEREEFGASEEWMMVEDEKVDFESLGILDSDDAETLEASSSKETNASEIPEKTENVKLILKCSKVSELSILNRFRNPRRNSDEKNIKVNSQELSEEEEVSSDDGQTKNSDYEPSIASHQNESLDEDEYFEEITKHSAKPSVDGVKIHAHFEPRRGKLYDQVRKLGNGKYLFLEKYSFELNAENKWVCSSCKHPYATKSNLLVHLVKSIEASAKRRNRARKHGESASDCLRVINRMKKAAESSDYEIVPDTEETEELIKSEDCLSKQQHNDQLEAYDNGSQSISFRSVALELEEETNNVISDDTPIPSCLNPLNKDAEQDGLTPEGTNKNVNEEVQIRVVCNLFRKRPEFKNRIQKTGPSEYLLDDKISFEFVNNKWRCIPCELEYAQKYGLMRHFYSCPGNQPIDSVETFRLNQRIYDKLKGGKFQCRHCKQIYSSNNEVVVHLPRCHEWRRQEPGWIELEPNKFLCNNKYPFEFTNDKFKCGSCSAAFIKKKKILSHIRSKHIPTSGTKWMSVKNTTPDKFIVNNKFSFEKVGDEYKCCECIYSSTTMKKIREHMREKHINFGKFSCGTCGRKYGSQSSLTTHEKWHRTDRTFVCEICGNSFKTANSLSSHKDNIHPEISERNFLCPICGKAFRTQGLLNTHSKIHERTECDICGKRIANTAFKKHVASHRNSKNHECKKCGKRYQYYNSLYVHLKSHDGVKPYSCDICDMKFTQHYNVTRHKNVAHNPNKPTKTYAKSQKRKHQEVSSEEEHTDEEKTYEEELCEDEVSDGESSSSEVDSAEEEV